MSFSNWLEIKLLNLLFSDVGYSVPNVYMALWIGNPGEDGAGGSEVSGGGYVRVLTPGNIWSVDTGPPTMVFNALDSVTFPEVTVAWGTVTHFAFFDALTGGNMLVYGALEYFSLYGVGREFTVGSIPRFEEGSIGVSLD